MQPFHDDMFSSLWPPESHVCRQSLSWWDVGKEKNSDFR